MQLVRIIRELPLDDEVCWCRVSALTPGIEGGRAGTPRPPGRSSLGMRTLAHHGDREMGNLILRNPGPFDGRRDCVRDRSGGGSRTRRIPERKRAPPDYESGRLWEILP